MPASRRAAVLYATAAAVIWGFTFLSIKVAVAVLPPMTLGFARFFVASLLLALTLLLRRRPLRLARKDAPLMIGSGLVGVTLYFLCENNGVLLLSASEASLIIGTIPIATLLADRLIFKSKLAHRTYLGSIISVLGVTLLVVESLRVSPRPIGYLYLLLAALAWTAYGFLTEPLFLRYDRLEITFWQSLFGMLGFIPFLFFEKTSWGDMNRTVLLNVLYLGIFGSAAATLFYVAALEALGPSTTNVYNNLIPVVSVVAAFVVLGERLTALQLLGGAIAIGGVFLATAAPRRAKARQARPG